jgi:hypothetical protein
VSTRVELDLESEQLQEQITAAIADPVTVVGRQWHIDESVPRWTMRAVLHVLAAANSRTAPVSLASSADLDMADRHGNRAPEVNR